MAQHLQNPIVDWKDCPLVEVNYLKLGGTPILKHTRMPADAIFESYMGGMSPDEIAEVFDLPVDSHAGAAQLCGAA